MLPSALELIVYLKKDYRILNNVRIIKPSLTQLQFIWQYENVGTSSLKHQKTESGQV